MESKKPKMISCNIYLTPKQHERMRYEAFEAKTTMSEIIRRYINGDIISVEKEVRETKKSLKSPLAEKPKKIKKKSKFKLCQKHNVYKLSCGCE